MDACPPLEDIAAFLDGTLTPEERERMTEHLARCESCYEIFAGAAHFQEEEEGSSAEDTGGRGVLPFPLRVEKDRAPRRIPRWLPLAASFLLVAALGFMIWQNYRTLPDITMADLVEPLQGQPQLIGDLYQPKDPERGGNKPVSSSLDAPQFLVGVYLVDLRLSAKAGDVKNTQEALYSLSNELDQVSFMQESTTESFKDEAGRITSPAAVHRFASTLPRWEGTLQNWFSEDPFFSFGLWTEAGRLSAVAKSPKFFERRMNRRFLSAIPREIPADERYRPILNDLRKIEELWGKRRKEDYEAIGNPFEHIIDQMEQIQKQDQASEPLPES